MRFPFLGWKLLFVNRLDCRMFLIASGTTRPLAAMRDKCKMFLEPKEVLNSDAGRNGFHFFPFSPREIMQERAMPFSTKSYLAGVGTVVAAITIGFSGGYFLAPPTDYVEQNRLQRVTSAAPLSNPAPPTAATPKLEITEASAAPTPATESPPRMIPVMAKAVEPAPTQVAPKAAEPARRAFEQDRAAQSNSERMRAAGERKRKEQRLAEGRKQREIELATVAVKRLLRDRDPQQVAYRTEAPRFGFFGED